MKSLIVKLGSIIIITLRGKGGIINSAIVKASATGIILKHDMRLLKVNGGHIKLTKHWAQSFLDCMGFVKRRASSKAKVCPKSSMN